jgi:hypothetical protein
MGAPKILVATGSFMAATRDGEVFVNVGTHVRSTDPIAKAHPELFGPAEPEIVELPPVAKKRRGGKT